MVLLAAGTETIVPGVALLVAVTGDEKGPDWRPSLRDWSELGGRCLVTRALALVLPAGGMAEEWEQKSDMYRLNAARNLVDITE